MILKAFFSPLDTCKQDEDESNYDIEDDIDESHDTIDMDDVVDTDESMDVTVSSVYNEVAVEEFLSDVEKFVSEDISQLYKEKPCKDQELVLLHDVKIWNSERPEKLVNLLRSLCKLDDSSHSNYLLAGLIEKIYKCRNSRLVLPLSFQEALVTYTLPNSAQLSALNSKSKPSGSHTYITSWLNKSAANEIEFPPGAVRTEIGKRYRVKADQSNVPSSVISSCIYLLIDESSK